jgi:N utilization substance protein B
MANRHLSRSIILQTLFEWDFKNAPVDTVGETLLRNIEEFGPGLDDTPFMERILELVVRNREVIDQVITKAAPQWPLEKINAVDRNVLRLGLGELLFGNKDEVPPRVAINEAIELAKSFGGDSSSRFVNGVLGAVYKELGEPGKEHNKDEEPVDISKLPIDQKAGAVVYAKDNGTMYLALVHDVFGYWTLSKGGVEPEDESPEAAAIREIKEEMGIDIVIKNSLGTDEYVAKHPTNGRSLKRVTFFLAEAPYDELHLESSGGLDAAQWFKLEDVAKLKMYDSVTALIAKAIPLIS